MIRLQFSSTNKINSKIIEWFSSSVYSHVDAVLEDGRLLGARSNKINYYSTTIPAGVQIRPSNYMKFNNTLLIELPADEETTKKFYSSLHSELGKPYDKKAILGFFFDRNWRNNDAWFCSELIGNKLELCGWFPYKLITTTNKLIPGDLLLAISVKVKL